MTRKEKKEELIGLFAVGAIFIGDLIDECFEFGQQHPCWISVEEELPEENKWVLTYNGSSINLLMLAGDGGWYDHSVAKHRIVTHWMPLPAAPTVAKNATVKKKGGEQIIGTADHIKIAMDVMNKKGGEK